MRTNKTTNNVAAINVPTINNRDVILHSFIHSYSFFFVVNFTMWSKLKNVVLWVIGRSLSLDDTNSKGSFR